MAGLRWQLRPALAALALLLGAAYMQSHGGGWATALLYVAATLCAAVFALVALLMPPYVDLDVPCDGCRFEHVGFRDAELELSPETQQLIAGEAVERPTPRFSCRVYYPAATGAGAAPSGGRKGGLLAAECGGTGAQQRLPLAKYATADDSYALSQVAGVPLPPFVYSHLRLMTIRAAEDAARHPDANNLPVIALSHGLTAIPICYWSIVGALVRAGHVVAVPTHNDGSAAHVALEDGTALPYQSEALICGAAGHDMANEEYKESHSGEIEATMKEHRCGQLRRRAVELSCSLDYVLSDETAGVWSVDPQRVAFVGHSFGGATAFLASELDDRAACCVCYDPWVEPEHPVHKKYLQAGMRRCPGLHMICSDWEGGTVDKNVSAMLSEQRMHAASRRRVLPDTAHQSYTDFALLAPTVLRKLGMLGSAESRPMIRTIVAETLAFIREAIESPPASTFKSETAIKDR
jgi:hypothetical protein